MRSLTKEKIDLYLNINFSQFKDEVMKILESGNDGAILINQDGQILAERVYLTVNDPGVEIPEGTGTRHISACSFSTRNDVLATFTLSEETLTVRIWKDGVYTEQYNPNHKGED
jgi:DNA integrity scanning protein DisA with diadenylate cyclase activity